MPNSSSRPAVVVTGASRGIGYAVVRTLVSHGFDVFGTVRTETAAEALRTGIGSGVTPVRLDVTDASSVAAAAASVRGALGDRGLAGLVNNAGIAPFGPVEQMPLELFESVFRVNVFGVVAVTQAFLPLVRKASGRIVNISSVNGRLSGPSFGAYSASKFALEALSDALRAEMAPWGIRVAVVQPGGFDTSIRAEGMQAWVAFHDALPQENRDLYDGPYRAAQRFIEGMDAHAPSVQPVADAVYEALTAERPKTRYPVGDDWAQFSPLIAATDEERDAAFQGMFGDGAD